MESLFGIPMDTLMVILLIASGIFGGSLLTVALTNRVFVRIGLRNIGRRRGRTVLIVLGLMLGTAIIAAAFNTGDTMTHTVRSLALTAYGSVDEVISVQGADANLGELTEIEYFDEDVFPAIEAAAGESGLVDGITPAIIETVAVQDVTSRQNEPRVTIFATDPARTDGFGTMTADGEVVSLADLGPGEVYLNEDAADELKAKANDELLVFASGQLKNLKLAKVVDYQGAGGDSAIIMPLDDAQTLLGREGQIRHVLISNQGGALDGVQHTDAVVAALEPALAPHNLEIDRSKEEALDLAEEVGNVFTTVFVTFGSFSIIAGILLIFLIFVMLAQERRSEMGIARAVGMKRRHLVQTFLYEGVAYDLVAAAFGAALGLIVAYGMVFIMSSALAAEGLEIQHDLRPRSLIVAYTLGVLLTAAVVAFSSWQVSVLNIVTAIRDLPAPPAAGRRRSLWVLGVVAILLGVLLTYAGINAEHATPFTLGTSLVILGFVPLLRAAGASDRIAYTIPGLALVVWWLLPFDTLDPILPDNMAQDFSLFILSGIMVVIGATWVVMYNSDLLLGIGMAVVGRVRTLAAVMKTAISYPLTNRFRTGMSLAMFTLVVFTVVVMSTTTNAFTQAFNDEGEFSGGFDILASTVVVNPIDDMAAAVENEESLNRDDFEVFSRQSFIPLEIEQQDVSAAEFKDYPVHGFDQAFLTNNTYEFAITAEGYETDSDVWNALNEEPGLAIVDSLAVPTRQNYGFAAGLPDFQLEGFYLEDDSFTPVDVGVFDPQTDTTFTLTIIAVLKPTAPFLLTGVGTSQEALPATLGDRAIPNIHLISLQEGVDAEATANAMESAFLENGMEATSLAKELEDAVATSNMFNYVLQGFMGLGLIVGVAALGVISARNVVERRQQIGVLRAIGFQTRMVQLSFLIESSFVALVGIVLGTGLGLTVAFNVIRETQQGGGWSNITFAVPWLNLVAIFAIVYVAALIATFVPARQAARVHPAQALRYE